MLALIPVAYGLSPDSRGGQVSTRGSALKIRSTPSTQSAALGSLSNGSYVTLVSKSGSWWKVEYAQGRYGYCHGDYIRTVSDRQAVVNTNSSRLNVRSGPGTSYARTGSIPKGTQVIVLSTSSGWSRVLYQGTRTGYVSAQYLADYYGKISLYVPDYKQTDSRWASVQIGQSGKTMAQIGCATTAVAMMESHRQGKTIYPDVMASQLRYTPDGSLYWPAEYTAVTDGTNVLQKIYGLLSQGKPVLYGARNSSGKQHWVVITGFTGGTALTASGFTIRDPGSSSRTNLQMFWNAYPAFYKYFYY